jgi:hypothetical protein
VRLDRPALVVENEICFPGGTGGLRRNGAAAASVDAGRGTGIWRGWPLPARIDRVYDASLAREELGWTPRHGFRSVLALWDDESSEVMPPRMGGAP